MKMLSQPNLSNVRQTGLIVIAIATSLAAGISGLIYPSNYAPLLFLGGIVAVIVLISWFLKPIWALYVVMFVVLIPAGLMPDLIQSYLNRSMTVVALVVWMFDAIVHRRRIVLTIMDVLMIGFLVWSLVTLSWADRFDAAQVTIQVYLMRFVLYLLLVSNQVRKKEDLEGVMNVLMLNGGFLIVAGIIGFLTGGFTEGARFKILGVNENGTGILLLVTLPGIFWKLRQKPSGSHNKIKTLLAFVYLFVVIGLVALSGSRGSAISYLITLLIFVFWKPTRPWLMLGLIIFLLAIIVAPFMFTVTIERFLGAEGNTVLGGREEIWPAGWQLIKDNPWFGVGIGNSPYAVTPYLYLTQPISTSSFTALHNPILVIWAETGIIGLFLYLGVMLSAVWLLVKQFFQHKAAGELYLMPYYAVVASVFIGFMASWFKGGGMESDYTYFLMLALMLIPSRLDIKNTEIEHSL